MSPATERPVSPPNPLAEALGAGRFCYVVELVASGLQREAKLLEVASRLARVPDVVAGSITSYAGGAMGHDPMRVGTAARARGLTPNVHVTCVGQDRAGIRKTLEDLQALGIENVFALTGDWPRARPGGPPPESPVFDLDSVHLVRLIDELRRSGRPFHVAVAVSPFKYVEGDCVWQYVKLEKKVAAGADCAITQVGWDSEKFRELKRYLEERGLRTPVLGNVYVLGPRAAERMARGEPPGCWVSPELLEIVRQEARGKDGGLRARLERAARTVAVLRGLGYAGAYLGGTHDADHVAWIIRRARDLAPRWEELAAELRYGAAGGFYLYGRPPARTAVPVDGARPAGPEPVPGSKRLAVPTDEEAAWRRGIARLLDGLGRLFPVTRDTVAPAGARPAGRLGGPTPGRRSGRREARAGGQAAALRLPGLRQLRPGPPRVRVPGDLPQAPPERPVRRDLPRALRGRRPAVRVGRRPRARPRRGSRARSHRLRSAARPHAPGHQLLDQLPPRPRQPAPRKLR